MRSSRNEKVMAAQVDVIISAAHDWLTLYEIEFGGFDVSDPLVRDGIVDILRGARMLLNGPTAHLDCGAYDARIVALLVKCGVEGAE